MNLILIIYLCSLTFWFKLLAKIFDSTVCGVLYIERYCIVERHGTWIPDSAPDQDVLDRIRIYINRIRIHFNRIRIHFNRIRIQFNRIRIQFNRIYWSRTFGQDPATYFSLFEQNTDLFWQKESLSENCQFKKSNYPI